MTDSAKLLGFKVVSQTNEAIIGDYIYRLISSGLGVFVKRTPIQKDHPPLWSHSSITENWSISESRFLPQSISGLSEYFKDSDSAIKAIPELMVVYERLVLNSDISSPSINQKHKL